MADTEQKIFQSNFTGTEIETRLNAIWPIGSVYITVNAGNPGDILGFGIWKKIEGKFLYATSSNEDAKSTGGNKNVTLTEANIPEHYHSIDITRTSTSAGSSSNVWNEYLNTKWNTDGTATFNSTTWGGGVNGVGEAFSILPPYFTVHMWYREE